MSFFRIFKIALTGLHINRMRTLLTTIGIVIGIATVIIVLSLGESAKSAVAGQLSSFGGNTIFAEIAVPGSSQSTSNFNMVAGVQITSLKETDVEATLQLANIDDAYGAIMSKQKMNYLDSNKKGIIMGTNASYTEIDETKVAQGRFFTTNEEREVARVVVLGPKLAADLFGEMNPVGQYIKIKQINFKVIGVLASRGTTFFINMDEMAFIPLRTAQKLIVGVDYITHFTVKIRDRSLMFQTASDLRGLLRKRHHIPPDRPEKDDFRVTTMDESLDLTNTIISGVTFLLTIIAVISLVVGGVGIMNIMYVSVSERTHEIGLRKAIGARSKQILWQFLLEAVSVTLVGGISGVMFGLLFIYAANVGTRLFGFNWPLVISGKAIILGICSASITGLVFGIYPARKAARLDPIVALRSE